MLYKYCTADGFDILLQSRLKAARIEDFNDPFELVFGVDQDTALENIKREFEENPELTRAWLRLLDDQKIQYYKSSPEDIAEKATLFQIRDFGRVANEIRKNWNEKMGIVCLSESPDVIQMWAHYAENHKGIVLGIEESDFMEDKSALVEVNYRHEMVCLPITATPEKLNQYDKYILDVIRRKESNWIYEKEIRLYVNLDEKDSDGNYYFKIPASSIKEIYLGLRSHETAELIAKSIKQRDEYNHLRIYKMGRHESAYKLKPQEI